MTGVFLVHGRIGFLVETGKYFFYCRYNWLCPSVLVDKKIFEGDDFNNLHERRNFQQYNPQCDDGFELKPIRPSDSCPEIFKIILEDKVPDQHHIPSPQISEMVNTHPAHV